MSEPAPKTQSVGCCDMMIGRNELCSRPARHLAPGTPLGPVAMCCECFDEYVKDLRGE